jgi:hypothetical protein
MLVGDLLPLRDFRPYGIIFMTVCVYYFRISPSFLTGDLLVKYNTNKVVFRWMIYTATSASNTLETVFSFTSNPYSINEVQIIPRNRY